jgi:hypothetical protein
MVDKRGVVGCGDGFADSPETESHGDEAFEEGSGEEKGWWTMGETGYGDGCERERTGKRGSGYERMFGGRQCFTGSRGG